MIKILITLHSWVPAMYYIDENAKRRVSSSMPITWNKKF